MKPFHVVRRAAGVLALCLLSGFSSLAVSTQTWIRERDTFKAGTVEGMVVSPDLLLKPGLASQVLVRPETGVLWSLLPLPDGLLLGGGEKTNLMRLDSQGKVTSLAIPGAPEVLALARGSAGEVFAANGPSGAVFRVNPATGEVREIWRPKATYIWALLPLPDGTMAVATGLPGRVFRLDPKQGKAETIWETTEDHVRSLALTPKGKILAGTTGSGLLVELDGKGGAFYLLDSDRTEAIALAVDSDGVIWAAFAGGSKAAGGAPAAAASKESLPAFASSVTVRARLAEDDMPMFASEEEKPRSAKAPEPSLTGGTLVRMAPGEEPETIWSDEKESPLALVLHPTGGVLLGTVNGARIYWFDRNGRPGLFDERKDHRSISALAVQNGRVLAAASNPAAVVSYGPGPAAPARWISDVLDAKVHATLGRVLAVTGAALASQVAVFARAGNKIEPGTGWSEWVQVTSAACPPDLDGGSIQLPASRYFQFKIEIRADNPFSFGISRVIARYAPVNRPPKIESIEGLPRGVALRPLPPPQVSSGEVPVSPPPRNAELERALAETSPPWRSKRVYEPTVLSIVWDGRDPDGDDLRYKLEYCLDRGVPCTAWTLLAEQLNQNFLSLDSQLLADGLYLFRVTADDSIDNSIGEGRSAERISGPIQVDNTPPKVLRAEFRRVAGGRLAVELEAVDPGGRLARAELSREMGVYLLMGPQDRVNDSRQETWKALIDPPQTGQELLLRVTDAAGNSSTVRPFEVKP